MLPPWALLTPPPPHSYLCKQRANDEAITRCSRQETSKGVALSLVTFRGQRPPVERHSAIASAASWRGGSLELGCSTHRNPALTEPNHDIRLLGNRNRRFSNSTTRRREWRS